jgi:hypothetical protein
MEYTNEDIDVNSLEDGSNDAGDSLAKKERNVRSGKGRNKRRFGYDQMSKFDQTLLIDLF